MCVILKNSWWWFNAWTIMFLHKLYLLCMKFQCNNYLFLWYWYVYVLDGIQRNKEVVIEAIYSDPSITSCCSVWRTNSWTGFHMLNEMKHNPSILVISDFQKSILPIIWSFFFGVTIRCLMGWNSRLSQVKLKLYFVMVSLYYRLKVHYASLLWIECITYVTHSKKMS